MQFMRTLDLDPDFVEAHHFSGLCYQRLGEDDRVISECERFLKRDAQLRYREEVKRMPAEARKRQERPASETFPSQGPPTPKSKTKTLEREAEE